MNLAALIGVAVGLAFVYLLLSLICSTVQEWIAAILRRRAATLREGLLALLEDPTKVSSLYTHHLIQSLVPPKHRSTASKRLSYMPSSTFAAALLENVIPQVLTPGSSLSQAVAAAPLPAGLKASLGALADRAGGDRDKFVVSVEKWFDDTMDRVSGWYKRRTQVVIMLIALVTTVALNVDTVRLARELYRNAGLRDAVNATANEYLVANPQRPAASEPTSEKDAPASSGTVEPSASGTLTDSAIGQPVATDTLSSTMAPTTTSAEPGSATTPVVSDKEYAAKLQGYLDTLTELKLPIGWGDRTGGSGWPIGGWLLTIIALSLGAPFWFDVLMRVANLRTNGPKPPRATA